jgi:ABC-2 type transport system permease protein
VADALTPVRRNPLSRVLWGLRAYLILARMWVRVSLSYRASFAALTAGQFLITGLEFVGIVVMFTNVDTLGGFGLREIALLYGATALGIGVADLLVGSVERIGFYVRTGRLDVMMTKPVPLLVQVCANEFSLRRLSRILQGGAVFAWAAWVAVDWTPARVAVAVAMVVSGSVIFFSLFVGFACVQFWTSDASEFANAFTYGGNTLTQYPLTIFPTELVKSLTFLLPVAFVNWYPCLFLLGRDDPFGLPAWLQLCSPVAAAVTLVVALAVWRSGVRHYTSTGS